MVSMFERANREPTEGNYAYLACTYFRISVLRYWKIWLECCIIAIIELFKSAV